MLMAFGGPRTHHRLMAAVEDAGFEIRDVVMWLYGSGFPKSHAIGKSIDKAAGAEREVVGRKPKAGGGRATQNQHEGWQRPWMSEPGAKEKIWDITAPATDAAALWDGWGTALKPAWEPIIVAMKPTDGTFAQNALAWGVAGLWVDGGRIETGDNRDRLGGGAKGQGKCYGDSATYDYISNPQGRWPANVILDEEAAAMLDEQSGESGGGKPGLSGYGRTYTIGGNGAYGGGVGMPTYNHGDTGGASRFFYCAKASRSERNAGLEGMEAITRKESDPRKNGGSDDWGDRVGHSATANTARANHHPTVKPLALMQYLCRLTKTPTGGIILDPFMGSGSTGIAAVREGRSFVGIELDADYCESARRRIGADAPLWVEMG
jgi:site-specific DNA-methyltransferase (adenine-specific)